MKPDGIINIDNIDSIAKIIDIIKKGDKLYYISYKDKDFLNKMAIKTFNPISQEYTFKVLIDKVKATRINFSIYFHGVGEFQIMKMSTEKKCLIKYINDMIDEKIIFLKNQKINESDVDHLNKTIDK